MRESHSSNLRSKHVLFLTQILPYPLDAGPKIRAYYTLRHLARQHDVTLLSFVRTSDPLTAIEHLSSFCQAVHTVPMRRSRVRDARHLLHSLVSDIPFLIARDWVPEMAGRIKDLVHRSSGFDAVHADQLWMAPYALLAQRFLRLRSGQAAIILDQHNAVFQIPRRLAQHEASPLKRVLLALEWRKLARHEREVCQRFDHVVWVTEEDQAALREQMSNGRWAVDDGQWTTIPICVDPGEQRVIQRQPDAHRVTFLGGLHWPPNAEGVVWFIREVWPRVRREVPHALLTIVGKDPPPQVMQYATRDAGCEVTGYVDALRPYLAETAVFVVPLHAGGGMRVKILDAWCWGLPVVTTPVGAEGIRVQDGENVLLADTSDALAQAVVRVLQQPELAMRLARGGRHTVETYYNWRKVYRAWDRVYERL